jgi:hypothetical protein
MIFELLFIAIAFHIWSRNVDCDNLMLYFKFQLFDCTLCEILWDLRPILRIPTREVPVEIDTFDETPYDVPRTARHRVQTPFVRESYAPPISAVGGAVAPPSGPYPSRPSVAGRTRDFDDPSSDSSY